jgi:hypothetical protein
LSDIDQESQGGRDVSKIFILIALALVVALTVGCAPGPNALANSQDEEGNIAGFWQGLWHGIIAPITFIISLFSSNLHMYEVHNNGAWYNFGYLIGMSIILGGGGGGAARRSRRGGSSPSVD